jgi:hypothetical protein
VSLDRSPVHRCVAIDVDLVCVPCKLCPNLQQTHTTPSIRVCRAGGKRGRCGISSSKVYDASSCSLPLCRGGAAWHCNQVVPSFSS